MANNPKAKKPNKPTTKKKTTKRKSRNKYPPGEHPGGAVKKLDRPEVREKFKVASRLNANLNASCSYAGITEKTYYNYINEYPEFLQEIENFRNEPYLRAVTSVVKNLDDPEFALKYLERTARNEFARETNIVAQVEQTNKYKELSKEELEAINKKMMKVAKNGTK